MVMTMVSTIVIVMVIAMAAILRMAIAPRVEATEVLYVGNIGTGTKAISTRGSRCAWPR